MKASRQRASAVVLTGLVGLAIVIGAIFLIVSRIHIGSTTKVEAVADAPGGPAVSGQPADDLAGGAPLSTVIPAGPAPGPDKSDGSAGSLPALPQPEQQAAPQAPVESADPRAGSVVQSFSCMGELTASRAWICTHWSVATMDYNLSLQYRSALTRSHNPHGLREADVSWLGEVDRLGDDPAAILKLYRQWQARLDKG